jgi:hypothetical protein
MRAPKGEYTKNAGIKNTKDAVLLTGITGNLGSWLAVERKIV